MSGRARTGDAGFTVLEFVYAASVLLIVSIGVMTAMGAVATSSRSSAIRVDALNLANERLEIARNLAYDSIGIDDSSGTLPAIPGSIPTPVTAGDFTVDTDVSWARDPDTGRALYKQVNVTVGWTEGRGGEVAVSSNIFGKSDLVNTGDVSITVLYRDTNEPVTGARVTLTPVSGTARALDTGSTGEAFYGYLPTGTWAVDVTKAGYIYDTAALSTTEVTADLLTSIVVYIQEPSTARVITVDENNAPVAGATVTLSRSEAPDLNATTNSSGVAVFDNLLVASYTAQATMTDRRPGTAMIDVTSGGQTVEVTIGMPARTGFSVAVVDGNDVGIAGATVRVTGPYSFVNNVSGSPKSTATNGQASFGVLADGWYSITVSKSGYETQTRTVTYDGSNPPFLFNLAVEEFGSIKVRTIRSNNGNARGNERVRFTGPNSYLLNATTNSSGYYTATGLVPGQYTVHYRYQGSAYTRTVTVNVSANMESSQNLSW